MMDEVSAELKLAEDRQSQSRATVSFASAALAQEKTREKVREKEKKTSSARRRERKRPKRSLFLSSDPSQLMRELTAEAVDLAATPLSLCSLRSCSEFRRMFSLRAQAGGAAVDINIDGNGNAESAQGGERERARNRERRSVWSRLTRWLGGGSQRRIVDESQQAFLIESLCSSAELQREKARERREHTHTEDTLPLTDTEESRDAKRARKQRREREGHGWLRGGRRVLRESSAAVDYLFGYPLPHRTSKHANTYAHRHEHEQDDSQTAEQSVGIELKPLKSESLSPSFYLSLSSPLDSLAQSPLQSPPSHTQVHAYTVPPQLQQTEYHVESERESVPLSPSLSVSVPLRTEHSHAHTQLNTSLSETSEETTVLVSSPSPCPNAFSLFFARSLGVWERCMSALREACPRTQRDDELYDALRLQPFSAGVYLRGLLLSGFSGACFHGYHLLTWSSSYAADAEDTHSHTMRSALFVFVLLQLLLHLLQMPCRAHIHFLCWESSRAMDRDGATAVLRRLVHSDAWLLNRVLSRLGGALSLILLVCTQVYLLVGPRDDVRSLLVSLSASNLVAMLCRVLIATCFSLSTCDTYTIAEARKRGLAQVDIESLPQKIFHAESETACSQQTDCAICLCEFEDGDRLTCLPCDGKHAFHSQCIQHWLSRQNSCPLCQRMI